MKTIELSKESTIIVNGTLGYKGNFTPLQSFLDLKKFMTDYKIERCKLIIGNFQIDIIAEMSPERFWDLFKGWTDKNKLIKEKTINFSDL